MQPWREGVQKVALLPWREGAKKVALPPWRKGEGGRKRKGEREKGNKEI